MEKEKNKKGVCLFLLLTVALSAVVEGAILYTKNMSLAAILMWMPALAAFITKQVYFRGEKHALQFAKCRVQDILLAVALPLAYIGIPYVLYWLITPGSMQMPWGIGLLIMAIVGIPIGMITAIGEEIGWRGFLVPRLATLIGTEKTLLLTGLIWGLWHCPLLISGLYMPGTPIYIKVPMFLIVILADGVIIGLLSLRTKSVWPAAVMHAAHNVFDQMIFEPGTLGANQKYFVSETGIFTAVISIVLAVLLYRQYKKEEAKTAGANAPACGAE